MRVVLLTEIIAPYRIPVFNEVHKRADFTFKVFFLRHTQGERHWPVYKNEIQFPYEVLPGMMIERKNLRVTHFNFGVLERLARGNFDVIITGGWHQPSYVLSLLYSKLRRKKFLLWCESTASESRKKRRLGDLIRRFFVRSASGAIVPGKASRSYLLSLGAKSERIWTAPNAVDSAFFSEKSTPVRREKARIKKERGLPENLLLYAGRLVKEKGVHDLLAAYEHLAKSKKEVGLFLCGDGDLRAELEARCAEKRITNVYFTGFLNREKLAYYYGLADIFVLPSHTEPWGLVVNEAMSCGLPVVCSSHAGAAYDLVESGRNGFVFDPGDVGKLAEHLTGLVENPEKRDAFGQASRTIIEDYSPSRCAEGFLRAVRETKGVPPAS